MIELAHGALFAAVVSLLMFNYDPEPLWARVATAAGTVAFSFTAGSIYAHSLYTTVIT